MADIKKYVWTIPVIAGILAIVSLLTPVASMNYMGSISANLWIWDLYVYNFSGFATTTEFIAEPMVMIPSLIATSLIAIGGVGCLVSGFILRKNGELRKGIIPSALMGTLFIVGELLWFILVPLNFPIENYFPPLLPGMSLTFWNFSYPGMSASLHTVGFGLIGGFLAAGVAFGGAGAARYYSKEREEKILIREEISRPIGEKFPSEKTKFGVKKYIWVLPLVGGVIVIISLLTPVASLNYMGMITASLWFWDLYTYNFTGYSSGTEFVIEPLVLIPSLISTCLLVIGGILLLKTGMKLKRRNLEQVNIKVPSILAGVVILIAEILWLSMVPNFFPSARFYSGYPGTFWSLYGMSFHTVGFGIIGGFLSTAIAFGVAGVAYYYSKKREVVFSDKKKKFPLTKEPTASETPELKFCPECGAELEDPDIKFCGKCGFDLKPPELAPL